jgi:peptide/nickel transport system substrate-binding protein
VLLIHEEDVMNFRLFSLIVLVALMLTACGGQTAPAVSASQAPAAATQASGVSGPVILHEGWTENPDTLNPAYAFLTQSYTIFDLIYSTLTTESPDGKYVGVLAKDWSVASDNVKWTIHLREGIKWHNGETFKASDIVWAINAVMQDPEGWSTSANYVNGFKEVTAPDDNTVQIVTEYPIANMEYRLSFLYAVYPPDFQKFTTSEELQNFNNFNAIGTGPFKINVFDKDKGILILDANKDYFDVVPSIDQMIFQKFDNADAMIQALKVGDIDVISEVPATAFQTIQGFENVQAVTENGRYFNELIINSVSSTNDPAPKRNPALEDPQVRLALATAINKKDLVDIVLQGLGSPGDTIVPPTLGGGFWHDPNVQDVQFDIAKANQILEDAGYKAGSDGVRAKGSDRLEFRLQFPTSNPVYPRIADMLASWFKQIGVKANVEAVDSDSLTAAITPTGDYDLVIWGWGPDPDPDFILSVLTTDQFVSGGWSDSGYHNPQYDQLYLDQQKAIDKNQRQQIIWKMQEMVFNDRPYIVLYYEKLLQAYRSDRFTGFIESPLGIDIAPSLVQVKPVK